MKLLIFTAATFLALFAFDTSLDAGCGGGGNGRFGRGVFGGVFTGNGPLARIRARFTERRAARQPANQTTDFSATYTSRYTAVAPVSMPQETNAVPQAPPTRSSYTITTPAPRATRAVRTPVFNFSGMSSGCANGNCAMPR